jgi:soluble lytic murein transglycosylase-like protein
MKNFLLLMPLLLANCTATRAVIIAENTPCSIKACYAHEVTAKAVASTKNIPFILGAKMITRESRWVASARGGAGEWGLTQIKCPTARYIGFKGACGDLADPHTNLTWGFEHLRLALVKCHGDWHGALTLHNQGLGAVCSKSRYSRLVMGG